MAQANARNQPGRGQTALITGASSGIGYELAKLFAQDGFDLVLVARTELALMTLARELIHACGVSVTVLVSDLADRLMPEHICSTLANRSIEIDILVNNAGFGTYGPFVDSSLSEELDMLQVNIAAPILLTRLLLPGMLERRTGKILNVASLAGFQPGPLMAGYYASKAYLLSFSEALAEELRGTGITVTALCPGLTRTGFHQRAQLKDTRLSSAGFRPVMDAQTVARLGYRALMAGKAVVVTGFMNKVLALLVRLTPRFVVRRAVRVMQDRRTRT